MAVDSSSDVGVAQRGNEKAGCLPVDADNWFVGSGGEHFPGPPFDDQYAVGDWSWLCDRAGGGGVCRAVPVGIGGVPDDGIGCRSCGSRALRWGCGARSPARCSCGIGGYGNHRAGCGNHGGVAGCRRHWYTAQPPGCATAGRCRCCGWCCGAGPSLCCCGGIDCRPAGECYRIPGGHHAAVRGRVLA